MKAKESRPKKRIQLRRATDYSSLERLLEEMHEVRIVLRAVINRVNWQEKNLSAQRLHTTQDVQDVITCQEFVRKS